ncbi:right-handed parallel beta-helix repeat-containing protein [Aquimarina pacifica]|uniref:right-handed parallel beta-helix repeat-containing protein n=1 Tax=Aquimarina pacifica TaxID=1296415 RepID=UPI0004713D57|nr:right-handed parallel beta-helix repeat-containing protein [Aquimarina pacifica]
MKYYSVLAIMFLCLIYACSSDPDAEEIGNTPDETENEVDAPNINAIAPTKTNFSCEACDHIIDTNTGVIDGEELNILPGQIIGLSGDGDPYKNLTFNNIIGTKEKPIIIRNCNGQAIIASTGSFGVKFRNSEYFKFIGDGDESTDYGIKISTSKGFFLTFEQLSSNFETYFIEIAGYEPSGIGEDNGFAGIGVKTSPYQDCDLFTDPTRTAWIMENVTVKYCYIHDVGGEGLYIGHGFYNGRQESDCSAITYSHSIQHIRIHNNIIEDVGYDGIQIKNADLDCELYNNTIKNYGQLNEGAHNEGLFIGGGTTGKFYNNYIINGTGHGIQFQGMGNVDIFNNVIANSGDNGFYGASGTQVYRIPDGYFNIINNTFVNSGNNGFAFFNNDGGTKRLINNIFAGSTEDLYRKGATIDTISNIMTQNLTALDFSNLLTHDYSIGVSSIALNKGENVATYGILEDIIGNARPENNTNDIGAYETKE